MNLLQRFVLALGLLATAIHVLYPPRVYVHNPNESAGRELILAEDFYKADLQTVQQEIGGVMVESTWNACVLDRDRFWVLTTAGVLLSVAFSVGLGVGLSKSDR